MRALRGETLLGNGPPLMQAAFNRRLAGTGEEA